MFNFIIKVNLILCICWYFIMYLVYLVVLFMCLLLVILFLLYLLIEKYFNEDSLFIIDDFCIELINYDEGGDGRC